MRGNTLNSHLRDACLTKAIGGRNVATVSLEYGRNMPVQRSPIKTVERNASTTGGEKVGTNWSDIVDVEVS